MKIILLIFLTTMDNSARRSAASDSRARAEQLLVAAPARGKAAALHWTVKEGINSAVNFGYSFQKG